ncbi:hypothetical protein HN371_11460 [Candidatus Poribacteria bacterium]|jgi:hypothetical protein|nr:hypothetical protein [Candidatus Poribacteria bacterium]MBT5533838.1 hypothetical protein [Candidatus Poribacteria bacterium]MBT5713130.1 hypothetical protein [Candidatus Poribacteria bacterium]MBT7097216.1 hypothetical protein [Candidatus Poribacteria bacterium]MBT7807437.1 hypothetical protein [Candidatus Poribacteria bacterium]
MAETWTVRPIEPADTGSIVMRCWPEDAAARRRLFATQHTIGMAAWDGDVCVGQLHCYAVDFPTVENSDWPEWNQWWSGVEGFRAPRAGRAWCHACFHVGRTVAKARVDDSPDETYFGRGIGSALCRASMTWAHDAGYAAVVAPGSPPALPAFGTWAGGLPWTTYAKLGFTQVGTLGPPDELPAWARGESPPHVMAEVRGALAAGRDPATFVAQLMMLDMR